MTDSKSFKLKLAGVTVGVNSIYADGSSYSEFLTDEEPSVYIKSTLEEIEEIKKSELFKSESDEEAEHTFIYRKAMEVLLPCDILLCHGVLVETEGKGILFTATSGTGKSTHARLWKEVYGDKVTIVNGDKPLLRFTKDGVFACGDPWQGKENIGCNREVPLYAICEIIRDTENKVEKRTFLNFLPLVLAQSYFPNDSEGKQKRFELVSQLNGIKFFSIRCNMDREAAITAYEGIVNAENN